MSITQSVMDIPAETRQHAERLADRIQFGPGVMLWNACPHCDSQDLRYGTRLQMPHGYLTTQTCNSCRAYLGNQKDITRDIKREIDRFMELVAA